MILDSKLGIYIRSNPNLASNVPVPQTILESELYHIFRLHSELDHTLFGSKKEDMYLKCVSKIFWPVQNAISQGIYKLFLLAMVFFRPRLKCCLTKSKIPLKLTLPNLTKRCLKCYLGREQSFDKGFRVQFSIFFEIGFENWQISA